MQRNVQSEKGSTGKKKLGETTGVATRKVREKGRKGFRWRKGIKKALDFPCKSFPTIENLIWFILPPIGNCVLIQFQQTFLTWNARSRRGQEAEGRKWQSTNLRASTWVSFLAECLSRGVRRGVKASEPVEVLRQSPVRPKQPPYSSRGSKKIVRAQTCWGSNQTQAEHEEQRFQHVKKNHVLVHIPAKINVWFCIASVINSQGKTDSIRWRTFVTW